KKLLAENEAAALTQIYNYAGQELYYYMTGMTGSTHDAEELLNELFIKIVEKKQKVAKAIRLKSYLYKMAANIARDRLKANKKHAEALSNYSNFLEAIDDISVSKEETSKAINAMNILPVKQREVVVMKIYMKKTFVEIGATLNISPNTAISRYRYAMKKMKSKLEQEL
ncbi:MAG: sigma-70 family RNA polymerase sigma factor, partial [Victivallaceae bacterium]|nr:sigma-70 family RNA polymerase sigma factor [Victivallaceae bacterium]